LKPVQPMTAAGHVMLSLFRRPIDEHAC
jgi:hypothetical protein